MRRKHSRITQLQELNSLNATRQRQPRQSWAEYLAANPELAQRARSTRTDKDPAATNSEVFAPSKGQAS